MTYIVYALFSLVFGTIITLQLIHNGSKKKRTRKKPVEEYKEVIEVIQENQYFIVKKSTADDYGYLKDDNLDFKSNREIWEGGRYTSKRFKTEEEALGVVRKYLSGDYLKPIFKTVWRQEIKPVNTNNLILDLIKAVENKDKEREVEILDKLNVSYKP